MAAPETRTPNGGQSPTTHGTPATEPVADGRRLRADRSRAAVVDALLAFYRDGVVTPGAAAIAERAGVSERSVYRHFDDLDTLATAAMERALEQTGPLFDPPPPRATTDERIAALVAQRVALHEAVGVIARATIHHATQSPVLANALQFRRSLLREQVATHFSDDLERTSAPERATLLDALDTCSSLEFLDYLCWVHGRSSHEAGTVVEHTLRALLHPTD